jgi:hypothetical protein
MYSFLQMEEDCGWQGDQGSPAFDSSQVVQHQGQEPVSDQTVSDQILMPRLLFFLSHNFDSIDDETG